KRALLSLEPGAASGAPAATLTEFRLDAGVPLWRYAVARASIEKRVFMPHRQNTVVVLYRVAGDEAVTLHLTPAVHFRGYEAPVSEALHEHYAFGVESYGLKLSAAHVPPLHLAIEGTYQFIESPRRIEQIGYPVEEARGYAFHGSLWSPGTFATASSRTCSRMAATRVFITRRTRRCGSSMPWSDLPCQRGPGR